VDIVRELHPGLRSMNPTPILAACSIAIAAAVLARPAGDGAERAPADPPAVVTDAARQRARDAKRILVELTNSERFDEALAHCREYVDAHEAAFGAAHHHSVDARLTAWTVAWLHSATPRDREDFGRADAALTASKAWMRRGEHDRVDREVSRASETFERLLPPVNEFVPVAAAVLARTALVRGQSERAETLARRAVALAAPVFGDRHPTVGEAHNILGVVLHDSGRLAEAELHLREGLVIRLQITHDTRSDHDVAESSLNLAILLSERGQIVDAERLARRALDLRLARARRDDGAIARARSLLARILRRQERFEESRTQARLALDSIRADPSENSREVALASSELAQTLLSLEQIDAAKPLFEDALEILNGRGEGERSSAATIRFRLAVIAMRSGDVEVAERTLREVRDVHAAQFGERHRFTVSARVGRALALEGLARDTDALEEWSRAARGAEDVRSLSSHGAISRLAPGLLANPFDGLAACEARHGDFAAAWQHVEAGRARGLLDSLEPGLLPPELEEEIRDTAIAIDRLEERSESYAGQDAPARLGVETRRQQLAARLVTLERDAARSHSAWIGRVLDLSSIQRTIGDDTAIVSWLEPSASASSRVARPWGIVVRSRGAPLFRALPGTGANDAWTDDDGRLVERVRRMLVAPTRTSGVDELPRLLGDLHRQRVEPLLGAIGARDGLPAATRLVVIPSRRMAAMPIGALTGEFSISYAPSASVYARLRLRRGQSDAVGPLSLLALGAPSLPPSSSFSPLPASRTEVRAIADIVSKQNGATTILLGDDASDLRLRGLAGQGRLADFRFLHFATHCQIDPRDGLQTALILAGATRDATAGVPPPDGDGAPGAATPARITAGEILRGWRVDADLVTLSACETALGEYRAGDGVLGFSQALFTAGSRCVLSSLWKVDDVATALLMERFYVNHLERGLDKAAALGEARRWLSGLQGKEVDLHVRGKGKELTDAFAGSGRERTDETLEREIYRHPFYWAGFVLVGDAF